MILLIPFKRVAKLQLPFSSLPLIEEGLSVTSESMCMKH